MRHWLLVGHASSAPKPGDYFLCEIAEESVIIARGKDDLLRAFLNICRHRGSRICTKSEGHAEAFVCPYHAWAYNLILTAPCAALDTCPQTLTSPCTA